MSSSFRIRLFRDGDQEAVANLWKTELSSSGPWNDPENIIQRKRALTDGLFLVGAWEGRIVATCLAGYDGVRGWLYSVAVSPDARRKSYGSQIVRHAHRLLQSRGCPKVNLQVRPVNTAVVGFYESLGYVVEDRISMGRTLDSWRSLDGSFPERKRISLGEGYSLTSLRAEDRQTCLLHLNESEDISQWTMSIPYPYTETDFENWSKLIARQTDVGSEHQTWMIRDPSDFMIGACGLDHIVLGHRAEIGYWLAKSYWRQGIATRAVRCLCHHAFGEYGLERITAGVFTGNKASARVLEKNGFVEEGTLRRHLKKDEELIDTWTFALLKDEFEANFKDGTMAAG